MIELTRQEYQADMKRMDEHFERDEARLNKHSDNIDKLTSTAVQLGEIIRHHEDSLCQHEQRLSNIEARPARSWDTAVSVILSAIISAAVAYLL
jgi:predicted nuclease with TOPRIM domain